MENLPSTWQTIILKKAAPPVYPRFLRQRALTKTIPFDHFLIEEHHSYTEVMYEQIEKGFWLMAIEIRGKCDNCYILKPKRSSDYCSINICSTSGRMGYRTHNTIQWGNAHIWFTDLGTQFEFFLEKDTVVKCCRMIFTKEYLLRLIGTDNYCKTGSCTGQTGMHDARAHHNRIASRAEVFLQSRLLNTLKYERGKYHYRASLISKAFELMTFFLNPAPGEAFADKGIGKTQAYPMLKAAHILEQHIFSKFPGIDSLARSCNLSPTKFKRDFKIAHGLSPLEYFRSMQVINVSGLLHSREKTVKELAILLGFKKHSDFSDWYRKITEKKIPYGQ